MNQLVGFGYALIATFLFGIYMVPRQYTRISQRAFLVCMGIGILISATIISLAGEGILPISLLQYILTFAAGLAWSVGALGYAVSVDYLGLSRATPIKNTYGALSTIFGIVIFHEFTLVRPDALTLAVVGSLAIVVSASLLGRIEATRSMTCPPADRRCIMIGVLFAVVSAIGYGVRSIPTKIVLSQGVSAEAFLFYMAHGAFVGNLIATKVFPKVNRARPTARDCLLAVLSGVTWTVAAEFLNLAVIAVGISVAFPLANLSTLIAVAYGLVILRDIDFRTHKALFWSGLVISVLGAALLAGALELRS
jgi:glucose uptake protein GlcU